MPDIPQVNSDTTNERSNLILIDRLWKLKKNCEKKLFLYIQLNRLIKDIEYRHSLIQQARALNDPEVNILIKEIEEAEAQGAEGTFNHNIPGDNTHFTPTTIQQKNRMFIPTVIVFVLSILIVIFVFLTSNKSSHTGTSLQKQLPIENAPIKLRVHGSNSVGEKLVPALFEAYYNTQNSIETAWKYSLVDVESQYQIMNTNRDVFAIELHAHGSSTGFKALIAGDTDIGMSSRRIKDKEVKELEPLLGDFRSPQAEHIVGLDGVAIVSYSNNTLNHLTIHQLAQLFSGEITNWREIGGEDTPVNVYARDENSGTWDTFKNLVLKPYGKKLSRRARRYESSTEMADQIATNPGAIGFIGLPFVRNTKLLAVASVANSLPIIPTSFTVSTEDYPLSRRLYIYTPPGLDNNIALNIVKFALSKEGQDIVESVGLASQNIKRMRPPPNTSAPFSYQALTRNAQRLSVNFRFDYPDDQLDNKALRDLDRLVQFMSKHSDKDLILIGFSDDSGDIRKNRNLSLRRAKLIEKAMHSRGIAAAKVIGYGEAIPIGANDTIQGRIKNRRVEAWLK
ncbi:MAG: phosphate ABC transporter substrate-binding/OmpA family protein [Pseudomonadota bacterium]